MPLHAVHRYRIKQLPSFFVVSNKRDVRFFDYNRQATAENLVAFASKVVPDEGIVRLETAAAANRFLKSDPEKVKKLTVLHTLAFQAYPPCIHVPPV